jgi:alkaline phosphatase D
MYRFGLLFWFAFVVVSTLTFAQRPTDATRVTLNEGMAPFYHGVASGDPLANVVIIWTRITAPETGTLTVSWKMATDTNLTQVVAQGQAQTDASKDYTVKVDVQTGLQPDTWYYYGFEYNGKRSITGRTKTAPLTSNEVRLAVVSCSNYAAGYFTAYRAIVNRNDVDAIVHLGDYIYEYGAESSVGRNHEPPKEIVELNDYRQRHSQYKLDPDLSALHQQFPWIMTWDDHESANNSYKDGAENHNPENGEGEWSDRKRASIQAYFEWNPIRMPDSLSHRIYRRLTYGNLVDIFVLDTRIEGRELQTNANDNTPGRTLLGTEQYDWLVNGLKTSTSKWKVLAQQVMMAPLRVFGQGVNSDQWDGYADERRRLLSLIRDENIKNVVVLTGDIHTSWGSELYVNQADYTPATGDGAFAVEFVVTSITSGSGPLGGVGGLVQSQNPHIKYNDLTKRGSMTITFTDAKVQNDWYYVQTITEATSAEAFGAGYSTLAGRSFLQKENTPAVSSRPKAPLGPFTLNATTGRRKDNQFVLFNSLPNPFTDRFSIHYYVHQPGNMLLKVMDTAGRIVIKEHIRNATAGLQFLEIGLVGSPAGLYYVQLEQNNQSLIKPVVKQ